MRINLLVVSYTQHISLSMHEDLQKVRIEAEEVLGTSQVTDLDGYKLNKYCYNVIAITFSSADEGRHTSFF